jgi:hypothetical protein
MNFFYKLVGFTSLLLLKPRKGRTVESCSLDWFSRYRSNVRVYILSKTNFYQAAFADTKQPFADYGNLKIERRFWHVLALRATGLNLELMTSSQITVNIYKSLTIYKCLLHISCLCFTSIISFTSQWSLLRFYKPLISQLALLCCHAFFYNQLSPLYFYLFYKLVSFALQL